MRTSLPLDGRTALVTGGAGGIGAACAHALVADGAAVVLTGRRRDALERTQRQLTDAVPGSRVAIHAGDACDEADLQAALDCAWALDNRLDIVVPTVGGAGFRPLLLHDADSFRAEIDLNLHSAFAAIRHAAPRLADSGGGAIVCISSTAARINFRWLSAYCAAKAALEALVRGAAEELAGAKIRVNAVRPGLTRSEATAPMFDDRALVDSFLEQIPLGTLGEPQAIAHAVRYLAGPESGWVTGQSFAVDGGHELRTNPRVDDTIAQLYGTAARRAPREHPPSFNLTGIDRHMNRVANKVALVTGAASGVGRADALLLAAEGARVVLTDIDEDAGRALAREIGDAALFVRHDIADEDGWRHAIASTLDRFGRLDVLVNNAAICPVGSIEDTSLDTWRRVMRTNADGYFLGCKYAIGAMKGNDTPGSIVMMSSVAALGGLPMMCAYTGSKGAVTALARSVAVHCKRSGYRIRCNSIHPDGIWTPMTQALMPDLDPAALGIGSDPMARMCDPQDVANLVLFLASDESRFVNGAELRIDNAQLVSSL